MEEDEYLELFDKVFKKNAPYYDRFIHDIFEHIENSLNNTVREELVPYKDHEDYDYYYDSFYVILYKDEIAVLEPVLKEYIKNKFFSKENGYLNFDSLED